jgi:hypothetical protein
MIQQQAWNGTVILCLTALTGCAAASVPSWCASENGDVAYSTEPGSVFTLDPVWQFQPEDPLQFPVSITVSDEGTAAVLDFAARDVVVVTPDGASAGAWVGVDQVQSPFALNWSGSSLVVFDVVGEKVVWTSMGASVREAHLPSGSVESLVQGAGATWAGVLSDGTVLLQPLIRPDMDRPDVSWQQSSVFKIRPSSTGASLLIADELGESGAGPRAQAVQRVEKPDQPSAYGRIVLGQNGEVLVQRDRPSPLANEVFGRPGAMYDVFYPDGEFVGQVQAPEGAILHAILNDSVTG